MQINVNFETVKKVANIALVLTNFLAFAGAVHYYNFRRTADPVFQVMEFDLNSRKAEIQKAYQASVAAAQAPQTPPTTVPPTTLAPKAR